MKIRFLGPLDRVTGSCYWLCDDESGVQFLVDCGMVQGEASAESWNHGEFPFDPAELSFVILTHAHIDHSGLIPLLHKRGFRGKVLCTEATAELAQLLLRDTARLPGSPFGERDVAAIRWKSVDHTLGRLWPVGKDIFLSFARTGHILGAVSVNVLVGAPKSPEQRCIQFSGDVGVNEEGDESQPLQRHRERLHVAPYLVLESTYGGRERDASEREPEVRRAALERHIRECVVDGDGVLVLPAFSVQRMQDLLYDLHVLFALHPEWREAFPVVLHAPLAAAANRVFADQLRKRRQTRDGVKPLWLGEHVYRELGFDETSPADMALMDGLLREMLLGERPQILEEMTRALRENPIVRGWHQVHTVVARGGEAFDFGGGPGVLLTSGGMCDGGPVTMYFDTLLRCETTRVVLTGYAGPRTSAGRLLSWGALDAQRRALLTDELTWTPPGAAVERLPAAAVRAEVAVLEGYSGHADQAGLLRYLRADTPRGFYRAAPHVFLTHGGVGARRMLKAAIDAETERLEAERPGEDVGVTVELPDDPSRWFDLPTGRWCDEVALDDEGDELTRLRAELEKERARRQALEARLAGRVR